MTHAEHPVQSPEVTTSVNSSAHCGFSGGIGPPYSARRRRSDTVRPCPRSSKSSATGPSPSRPSGGRSPGSWMVDSRYGRGGTTAARLRAALVGRSFTAARRRGKLLLLDTDGGPTLGLRFGMTGGLVVDGRAGARPPALRAGRLRRRSGCEPASPSPTAVHLLAARPPPLRVARARARRGTPRARRAQRRRRPSSGRPGRRRAGGAGRRRRSRPGSWTRSGWPAWATCWRTRSSGGPGSLRGGARRSTTTSSGTLHTALRSTLRQLAPPGWLAHGRPDGGAPRRGALPARRHRAAPRGGRRPDHLLVPGAPALRRGHGAPSLSW